MVRAVVIVFFVVCIFGVYGMPGKRVRRGYNANGYGSERGGEGRGGYNHGSGEDDASVSREDDEGCGGQNSENRGSSYGREDYNSNERRHGNRSH